MLRIRGKNNLTTRSLRSRTTTSYQYEILARFALQIKDKTQIEPVENKGKE